MGGILFPTEDQKRAREMAEQVHRQMMLNESRNLLQAMINTKREEIGVYVGANAATPSDVFEALVEVAESDLKTLLEIEKLLKQV